MKRSREELEASNNGGSSPDKIIESLDVDEEILLRERVRGVMKRSREELEASNNGGSSQNKITESLDEEVKYPPLNLALTTTPEFIKQIESLQQQQEQQQQRQDPRLNLSLAITPDSIKQIESLQQQQEQQQRQDPRLNLSLAITPESIKQIESLQQQQELQQQCQDPRLNLSLSITPEPIKQIESHQQQQEQQQQRQDSNSTPSVKKKAMNFPISKITIGEWTCVAVNEQDLKAKIYFSRKKIIWEFLQDEETTTTTTRLSRKIEMSWSDVLSLNPLSHRHDQTGILQVELSKPPKFWIESNTQVGKPTQWQQTGQDFTLNHSASRYRIHTLHFAPGVLQENMEKLLASGDLFWSELLKVHFPTLEHLYFDEQ